MGERLQGVRLLLVDDDDDTLALYTFALAEAGAEVRTGHDAAEAIRSVTEWAPTVIVSDLVMPGVDAAALLKDVRSLHPRKRIPAIAVTGRSSASDRREALAAGFQEHAVKPLVPDALIALVSRCATAG
jgi:CheY-like chemotaxis protein